MEDFSINYDESQVPHYTLPDPLTFEDGRPVVDAAAWTTARRPELVALFEQTVYGRAPARPEMLVFEVIEEADDALEGHATRKQVAIRLGDGPHAIVLDLLIYLPHARSGPAPLFVGLNFMGNHTVTADPAVRLPSSWVRNIPDRGVEDHQATPAMRGSASSRWALTEILARGYGLATLYCGDIDPDFDDGFRNGVHALYERDDTAGDAWGTLSAWAWGLSRALDYFETDPAIDAARVAVLGHSRLGKTALWAGASDPRFALVVSNDSGCGGAALSRRRFGETVRRINTVFPHWFCTNFKAYNDNEAALPVDQHELLALIAPRPLYVASAAEDLWADPRGEFLAAHAADPVYRLLGTPGLPADTWPEVDRPVWGSIGYHVRAGGHDVTAFDWAQYLAFADRHLG